MNERGRGEGVWVQRHAIKNCIPSDNEQRNEGNVKVLEEIGRLPERANPADLVTTWDRNRNIILLVLSH